MRRTPALTVLALAGVLLSCDDGRGAGCTIVTDGSRSVFVHERAHCNGWEHPMFQPADPPRRYRREYDGQLTVYQCGGGAQHKAPAGTIFIRCRSALKQCQKMWRETGLDLSQFASLGNYSSVNGCQFFK